MRNTPAKLAAPTSGNTPWDRRGRARIPFEELPPQTQLEGTECCVSMLLRAQILDGKCPAEFQLELSASFREEATPHLSSLQACPLGPAPCHGVCPTGGAMCTQSTDLAFP